MGLGLAPAKTKINFNQQKQEGRFRVIVDNVPTKVILTTEGELGQFINLEKDVFVAYSPETWINFDITLPEELPPGERHGGILVIQAPEETSKENVIVATTAISHKVKVMVPYPGKYIESKVFIQNNNPDEPVLFTIAIVNYGKDNINSAKASIVVKGPTNEEIITINTEDISIEVNKEKQLKGIWQPDNPGSYILEISIEYDGKVKKHSQTFSVGSLELEIEDIKINNFKIGQIAKLDIYLRNKWNKDIDVDGKVEIFKEEKLVSSFNTIPVNILDSSSGIMEAYWNTENMGVGEYDITVNAEYGDKSSQKTFSSVVSIDNIQIKNFDAIGKVVDNKNSSKTSILIMLVFMLIVLNIGLFIFINKKLKNKEYK